MLLLRHAKSSWNQIELSDFDRPLLEKGLKRSKLMIDYLLGQKVQLDYIVSSPAVRAKATAEIFARGLNFPVEKIRYEKKIYHGDGDALFEQFFDIPQFVNTMMIVGHNPSITNFANYFLDKKIDYLPTSGVVSLGFKTDRWEKIATASRIVNFVVYPKMFRND